MEVEKWLMLSVCCQSCNWRADESSGGSSSWLNFIGGVRHSGIQEVLEWRTPLPTVPGSATQLEGSLKEQSWIVIVTGDRIPHSHTGFLMVTIPYLCPWGRTGLQSPAGHGNNICHAPLGVVHPYSFILDITWSMNALTTFGWVVTSLLKFSPDLLFPSPCMFRCTILLLHWMFLLTLLT